MDSFRLNTSFDVQAFARAMYQPQHPQPSNEPCVARQLMGPAKQEPPVEALTQTLSLNAPSNTKPKPAGPKQSELCIQTSQSQL